MHQYTLASILAFASVVTAAPVEEVFYEWLAPDKTTVLCSSKIPGSCDPYADDAEGEEFFLGSSTHFEVTPLWLTGFTQVFSGEILLVRDTGNYLRLRYSFEADWDLGWYAFAGGTGDFLAEYWGACGDHNYWNRPGSSFSVSSPFPIDDLCATGRYGLTRREETFGEPFHQKGHYRVVFDEFAGSRQGFYPGVGIICCIGYDPDMFFPPSVEIVPVAAPIPEPAGLTIASLSAMLCLAVARRRYSRTHKSVT